MSTSSEMGEDCGRIQFFLEKFILLKLVTVQRRMMGVADQPFKSVYPTRISCRISSRMSCRMAGMFLLPFYSSF